MAISFGGLATGLDTQALINELMQAERQPLTRMESDKNFFTSRQKALGEFNTKLEGFLAKIEELDTAMDFAAKKAASSEDFLSVDADSDAFTGNYDIEVVSLAQVQKSVSQGYSSKTESIFGLGSMTLTVGDNDPVVIDITDENNTLEGVMQAINDADAGVQAALINDGTGTPYRLMLSGEDVASAFSLTSSLPGFNGNVSTLETGGYAAADATLFGSGTISLSTGHDISLTDTNSLNDIRDAINAETGTTGVSAVVEDDGSGGFKLTLTGGSISSTSLADGEGGGAFSFTQTQASSQAHVRVDTLDIYGDSNTLTEAVPGVTLNLNAAEPGTSSTVSVTLDEAAIKNKIRAFVDGYNQVVSFVTSQSTFEGSQGGALKGDAGLNSIKRRLQDMLVRPISGTGGLSSMSQLGLETQKDGSLVLDDEILTDAIQENLKDVEKLVAGEEGVDGIGTQFKDYLDSLTDSIDGFYVGRKKTIDGQIRRVEKSMDRMELRLEKREQNYLDQFNALELLISGMNAQSDYLTAQLKGLENMWSANK